MRTNVELEVHQTLLKWRGSKITAWGGGTLGGAGGAEEVAASNLLHSVVTIQINISMDELLEQHQQ